MPNLIPSSTERRIRPLFLIALFSFVIPAAVAQQDAASRASTVAEEQDYVFATGLYRDSLYQMAAEQFDAFIAKYPASARQPEAHYLTAECRFRMGRLPEAIQSYTEYLRLYPGDKLAADAHFRKGQIYLQLKRNTDAIAEFRAVLDKYGDNVLAGESAYWIGEGFLKDGDYENAIKYYTLAYEGYPGSAVRDYALYSLGWTYQKKNELKRAIGWYEKLLTDYPSGRLNGSAHLRLAECASASGDTQRARTEALAATTAGLSDSGDAGSAMYLAADAAYRLGEFSQARAGYEQFLAGYPAHRLTRDASYGLAWTMLKLGQESDAEARFKVLAQGPDAVAEASLYRLGILLSERGAKDSAIAVLLTLPKRFPEGEHAARAFYDAAGIDYERSRWADARNGYESLLKSYPASPLAPDASRMVGECYSRAGEDSAAVPWFVRATAMANVDTSTKASALFQQAWSEFRLKHLETAAGLFRTYASNVQNPQVHEAWFWRGEALYALRDYAGALDAYRSASATSDGRYRENALYGIGWCQLKSGHFSDAVLAFERVIAEYPKGRFSLDARLRIGDAYLAEKAYAQATTAYRLAIRLFPDSTATIDYAYYQLGQSLQKSGDNAGAYKAFELLATVLPKSPLADDALYAMGWIDFQKQEFTDAIREFQKVLKQYPDGDQAPRALYSIGDAYYNQQMYVPAEKSYREVLRQYPTSPYAPEAATGIQYSLIALGREKEASAFIDDYIRQNPDAPNVQDLTLKKGDLLFNRKRYAEAAGVYRGFISTHSTSRLVAQAKYSLAECYLRQGNEEQAAQTFEEAGAVPDPKPPIAARALIEAGTLYEKMKLADRAVSAFSRAAAVSAQPDVKAEAGYRLGVLYEDRGNAAEASSRYEAVIRAYPREYYADAARVRLATLMASAGRIPKGLDLAGTVASGRTDDLGAQAQYVVGVLLSEQKEWTKAVEAFLRIRYVFPSVEEWIARGYVGLGEAYEHLNQLKNARTAYGNAVRMKNVPDAVRDATSRLKAIEGK